MARPTIRWLALLGLCAVGVGTVALELRRGSVPNPPRLTWLATAYQLGPVGYRDPAAAVSPDGNWLAYSEGRFLRVRPTSGGPAVDLPPADGQIRHIAWHPDSRTILTDGFSRRRWAVYDRVARTTRPLWPDRETVSGSIDDGGGPPSNQTAAISDLRQPVWSPDGRSVAAVADGPRGDELWAISADGRSSHARRAGPRIAFPAWTRGGELACVASIERRPRLTIPCGGSSIRTNPDIDVYGPLAFSPDGRTVYAGSPNSAGTLDLWAVPTAGGRARQMTFFSRDSYAPSVAANGAVVFKVQSYRTVVASAPAEGGPTELLATFQSETPSWDPTGRWIGVTYGRWRRIIDDANYPDIAQDAGIIAASPATPAVSPASVVQASPSEDQALCWSPNGRWIAFHSHKDQSDDIWLRSAGADTVARRISFLGRGAETGWPRWSADGRWLLFAGTAPDTRQPTMFLIGIDQDPGVVTSSARSIAVQGLNAAVSHAEWLPDSATIAAIAKEGPGRHVVFMVPRGGGLARIVHRFASEHDSPGLAVSPDGTDVAFIAPAPDGFFQVFRMPLAGGAGTQVTTDPSNKTQPAWSPDGRRLAFTVWSYEAQLWSMR